MVEIPLDKDAARELNASPARRSRGQTNHPLHMPGPEFEAIPAHSFIQTANQTFREHTQRRRESLAWRRSAILRASEQIERRKQIADSNRHLSTARLDESAKSILY